MAVISSSALKGNGYFSNNLKYNGKELVTGNFSDGTGLGLYNFPARNYDPAIGRWLSQDWLATDHPGNSPYNFVLNNPLRFIDLLGLDTISAGGGVPIKKGDDVQIAHGEYVKASANEVVVQAKRIPTFSEQVENTISNVWNSRLARFYIPDVVSIGGGFGFAKFLGAGYSNEFNWILRGSEASIYPIWTTTTNVIIGGASGFSINVGGATYLGPVSEINRGIVETKFREGGVGINVSVPVAEGLSATGAIRQEQMVLLESFQEVLALIR